MAANKIRPIYIPDCLFGTLTPATAIGWVGTYLASERHPANTLVLRIWGALPRS